MPPSPIPSQEAINRPVTVTSAVREGWVLSGWGQGEVVVILVGSHMALTTSTITTTTATTTTATTMRYRWAPRTCTTYHTRYIPLSSPPAWHRLTNHRIPTTVRYHCHHLISLTVSHQQLHCFRVDNFIDFLHFSSFFSSLYLSVGMCVAAFVLLHMRMWVDVMCVVLCCVGVIVGTAAPWPGSTLPLTTRLPWLTGGSV